MKEITILSKRNTPIKSIIVEGRKGGPLILMVHGFKANKSEDGRFLDVANALKEYGVNSIMFAQAGCDDSEEDFINFTLKNNLDDIETCYEYMKDNYDIDTDKVGMIGYSMGGRLTSLFIAKHPEIKVIALWAAATFEGFDNKDTFLEQPLDKMKKEASEKGYCDFYNTFDDEYIKLNKELIEDMEYLSPEEGLNKYDGCALIVHGDEDITVEYRIALETYDILINTKDRLLHTVKGADHGFGAWNNRNELSHELTDTTIDYFKKHLLGVDNVR